MADPTDDLTDDDLMNELRSLGEQKQDSTQPADSEALPVYQPLGPSIDRATGGPNAGQFGRDLMIGDLSTQHAISRRETEDRARDQSSSALFGDWDKLDDKGKKDWAVGEKSWADTAEWFWTGIKGRLDERRAATKGVPYSDLEGDPYADWLDRKITANIGLAKHRRTMAEAIEKGQAEGPRFGNVRAYADDTLRGVASFIAEGIKGATYGAAYIAGEPMSKAQDATLYKFAETTDAWSKAWFPEDEVRQHEFKKVLAEGTGSMIGFFGPSIAAHVIANAGPKTLLAIAGVSGALNQQGSMTGDALKAQAEGKALGVNPWVATMLGTDDEATAAFLLAAPIGASETLPLAHLFGGHKGQWIKRLLLQAYEEGGQEFGQTVAENVVARSLARYDEQRHWDDNAWTSMAVGTWAGVRREKI